MAKKLTVESLFDSNRFKKATLFREYNDEEKALIIEFINDIGFDVVLKNYKKMATLATYDLSNLVNRWKELTELKNGCSRKSFLLRFGESEGEKKFVEYGEKQRISNTFEFKKEKHGWTREQFDEYNKSRSVTLDNLVKKHGQEKGKEIYDGYVEKQRYTNTLEYYMEKYSDDGYEKWLDYNKEKGKSGKIDWVMQKYNVDHDTALDIIASRIPKSLSSDAELHFIQEFEKLVGQIQYTVKTKQFCIWNYVLNTPCFYDLADSKLKKIIEFHGDYWHCNPLLYDSDFFHKPTGKTASEIWQRDFAKKKAAIDRGFEVKVVWWSEFNDNPTKVLEECKEWWLS